MNKKILVPLDGSELAEKVLPYVIQLTARFQAETVLLHISAAGESESTGMRKAYIEHTAEKVREQLQEIYPKSKLSTGNIPVLVKSEVIAGDAASSILKYAEENKIDLIIMSKHGHSGIGHWLMGSVAHKVFSVSPIPVLIIHPVNTDNIVQSGWPRNVLVPLDGSKMSETVLSHVEDLFNQGQFGGEVTLVKVCEPPDLIADYPAAIMRLSWDEHVKQAKSAAKEAGLVYLEEKQKQLEAKGIKVNIEVVLGENAIPAITRYIREHPFDLVAMTTHGHSRMSVWPWGHVADHVIQANIKPLLLIRPPANMASINDQ
jgi:nucleotide-binding universal stress UspA family protein